MINPLLDKRHLKEYLLFGLAAGIVFNLPVIFFLINNNYENFYWLFIGSFLFFLVIMIYTIRLLYRPYDRKRALAILIAAHMATLVGIVISCILSAIVFVFFFPGLFSSLPPDKVLEDTPPGINPHRPIELLFMIFSVATIGNFSVGSFIALMMAYAGKTNQTKDKAVPLETHI